MGIRKLKLASPPDRFFDVMSRHFRMNKLYIEELDAFANFSWGVKIIGRYQDSSDYVMPDWLRWEPL